MKSNKGQEDESGKKDFLDHIENFIETHIEKTVKKSVEDVETFVKNDLLKNGAPTSNKKKPGPLSYLEAFLDDPKVAALHPSTKFLVDRVIKMADWPTTRVVVEYGPAEGVMTRRLLEQLPADGILAAIETNPSFIDALKQIQDPRLRVIHGSVLDVEKLLAPLNLGPADVIISGIPFSFLKPLERHQLLHKTEDHLRPGGRFIAYQVTTHLIPLMKYHFQKVDVQFEIRNLPPHFVFTGFK